MEDNRAEIHVGDTGTSFLFTFLNEDDEPVNLTDASTLTAVFKSSEGRFEVNLTAVDAEAGTAEYLTEEDDLDIPGQWRVQAFVTFSSVLKWRTNTHRFIVHPNVEV